MWITHYMYDIIALVLITNNGLYAMNIPMFDRLNAPLEAVLDISVLNEEIKAIIKKEVNKGIEISFRNFTNEISSTIKIISTELQNKSIDIQTLNERLHILENTLQHHLNGATVDQHHTSVPLVISTKKNDDLLKNPKGICVNGKKCYNGGTCRGLNSSNMCICQNTFMGDNCEYTDGKSNSFLIIFHEAYNSPSYTTPYIMVASDTSTRLSVFYFNNNQNKSVSIDKSHPVYNLDKSVLMSNELKPAGIEVHSDENVTVYGFLYFNSGTGVSEGIMAIPTQYLSTKYVIPSFTQHRSGFYSVISLTPVQSGTIVDINLRLGSNHFTYRGIPYFNNDTIKVVVNKYTTLQIKSPTDMSGTIVTASAPIAVVSGNTLTRTLNKQIKSSDSQPFMEMVLPIDQLDNLYIIPYIATRLNNTARVQVVNNTNLMVKIGSIKTSQHVHSGDNYNFFHTTVSYIRSSEDILVMIYPHELTNNKGDSFMMTIHGIHQYLPVYDIVVPTGFDSYISIAVQTDALDGFLVDGKFLNIPSVFSISEGSHHFSTFSLPISSRYHRIEHKKKVRFGLWVYGNHDPCDSYGYPGGIAYKKLIIR